MRKGLENTVQMGCQMEALEVEGVLRGGTKGPKLRKEGAGEVSQGALLGDNFTIGIWDPS